MKVASTLCVALILLCGCVKAPKPSEDLNELYARTSKLYYESPAKEARAALWKLILIHEQKSRTLAPSQGDVLGLALSYSRLAMMADAEGQSDVADALFATSYRYWQEVNDLASNTKRFKVNKRMAIWMVDSLEHDKYPRWRSESGKLPTLFYPKYEANAEGEIVEK